MLTLTCYPTGLFCPPDATFTLGACTSLRSCALRFDLREMCVPENQNLPWVTALLAQLASPALESLTLALRVDPMSDLRALDSECGVRPLFPALFNDLRALDWESVERTMMCACCAGVRRFVLEGRGKCALLVQDIARRCPDLMARRILEFAEVL